MDEALQFDVLVIGAGPAGLSCAIKLAQLSQGSCRIAVLEKGSQVGEHILSGAIFNPRALNTLIPDWQSRDFPCETPVTQDKFCWLTKTNHWRLPVPKNMENKGNYIISLSQLTQRLAQEAESLGVEIFPGFTAHSLLIEQGKCVGVRTGAFGVDKQGKHTDTYQQGIDIFAKQTVLAEGAHGSLSQQAIDQFELRSCPQTYGLGLKEVWQIPKDRHKPGFVLHTLGWPLDSRTYGGGFIYHWGEDFVSLGLIIGLDYQNTYLNTFQELQRYKDHPLVREQILDGKVRRYGARALNEGGWQALPTCAFKGGLLIGCAAGFLDNGQLKGSHTAMQSGITAAECIHHALTENRTHEPLAEFDTQMRTNWVGKALYRSRNIRPGFYHGTFLGLIHAGIDQYIFRGSAPWTWTLHADHTTLKPKTACQPIEYPKPDGVYRFDINTMLRLSQVNHNDDQPSHLVLKNPALAISLNYKVYDSPETRYCPARVYEITENNGEKSLTIHAQNCLHCKTCSIKDPGQNILWQPPEGGDGPHYQDT